jgi:hypothetical protein
MQIEQNCKTMNVIRNGHLTPTQDNKGTTLMSKNNTVPALSAKYKAPEHHRVKPELYPHQFHGQPGHCYCTTCGAIGFKERWYIDSVLAQTLRQDKNAHGELCPGCKRVEQQLYEGEVIVANAKFATLMGEIIAMIKHTEGRCWHNNPIAKIAAASDEQGILHIQTTTRMLAERIGKELQKSYKGNLEIKRTPGEKFVRVYWTD